MKTETSHIKTAIMLVSETGMASARLLLKEFPEAEIFTPRYESGCTHIESTGSFTVKNFNRYDAFIFIGALGICVRSIAPCVKDKYTDPAVICVDSTGKHAISVLSGHIGGANELTEAVAGALGAEPVITTQSDLTGLWALDKLPQRFGWSPTICVSPSTHLLAGLTQTPDDQMASSFSRTVHMCTNRMCSSRKGTVRTLPAVLSLTGPMRGISGDDCTLSETSLSMADYRKRPVACR